MNTQDQLNVISWQPVFMQGWVEQITGYPAEDWSSGNIFGLHSGALAAKEMGGSLTVHSDGPGQGAAFTLELPLPDARELT